MKTLKTFILDPIALRGKAFAHERGDCTVRAIMILLEVSYSAAHTIMHINGRNDALRGWGLTFQKILHEAAGRRKLVRSGQTTVGRFIARHPKGRFLLWISGHVFAVIDGLPFDSIEVKPRTKLHQAWQFPDSI